MIVLDWCRRLAESCKICICGSDILFPPLPLAFVFGWRIPICLLRLLYSLYVFERNHCLAFVVDPALDIYLNIHLNWQRNGLFSLLVYFVGDLISDKEVNAGCPVSYVWPDLELHPQLPHPLLFKVNYKLYDMLALNHYEVDLLQSSFQG